MLFFVLAGFGIGAVIVLAARKQIRFKMTPELNGMLHKTALWVCIILVLGQALISTVFTFQDKDDIYYVGLANSNIDAPALYAIDPSTGDAQYPVISQYRVRILRTACWGLWRM